MWAERSLTAPPLSRISGASAVGDGEAGVCQAFVEAGASVSEPTYTRSDANIGDHRMSLQRQRLIAALALLAVQAWLIPIAAAAAPSGQYFQIGFHGFTPPGKLVPESFVMVQIDVGTREVCEARLAVMVKTKEVVETLGADGLWCSSESASAKLKYHGVFRNRITGKTLHMESNDVDWCKTAAEFMTGGQAANNKIEVVTECQAR